MAADGNLEQKLRKLEARQRAMVDHAPEAIVVFDVDRGIFTDANPQACELFGMSLSDLQQVGLMEMSAEHQLDGTPSRLALPGLLDRVAMGETPWFEWVHCNAAGQSILCRVQLASVPAEGARLVRASILDLSDIEEREKARQRLRVVLDVTPDIIAFADGNGRIEYINTAGRDLFGILHDEELGDLSLASFHTPEWAPRILDEVVPAAMRDGVWCGETELRSRTGAAIPVSQVLIAHSGPRGDVEYLAMIARDIRERRAAQELERKALQAQKLESLGVLAGGIAHDFNNILVGVLTNASLAASRVREDESLRRLLLEIEKAGRRAADLAHQMLNYAGKSQTKMEAVHVEDLTHDVSRLVSASISKNTRLDFEFGEQVPPIFGDETQLRQVLMNLILNASEALHDEPGVVRVRSAVGRLDRSALLFDHLPVDDTAEAHVMLEVKDDGEGIEPPLDRVFDPFFTTKFTGRGLGLAAAMGIVKAHEGGIQVESSPGRGTTFRLWFRPLPGSDRSVDKPVRKVEPRRGRGVLLIVDDEAVVRDALGLATADLGFDVLGASSGSAAERTLRDRADDIVAVMVDLTMPGTSGLDVIARLRLICPDVPVVLMSGYSHRDVDAPQANAFLRKPFTVADIATVLDEVLVGG